MRTPTMYNPAGIQVGDFVQCPQKLVEDMSCYRQGMIPTGKPIPRGVVIKTWKDYDWRGDVNMCMVRRCEPLNNMNYGDYPETFLLEKLTLLEEGDGTVTPGVHFKLSDDEAKYLRLMEYHNRCLKADTMHQGWSNAATCIARQLLAQEPMFHQWLHHNLRQDGTINEGKIEKQFRYMKLKVDDWCFEPPVEAPAEFGGQFAWYNPYKQKINWAEIADSFATLPPGKTLKPRPTYPKATECQCDRCRDTRRNMQNQTVVAIQKELAAVE